MSRNAKGCLRQGLSRLRALVDSPLGAVLGGAFYGSWAALINGERGLTDAARIGLTHCVMSTSMTLIGVRTMNRLFRQPRRPMHGAALACAGSLVYTYSLLVGVHLLLGTPHIFLTLLPGLGPTFAFCTGYSWLLLRTSAASAPIP